TVRKRCKDAINALPQDTQVFVIGADIFESETKGHATPCNASLVPPAGNHHGTSRGIQMCRHTCARKVLPVEKRSARWSAVQFQFHANDDIFSLVLSMFSIFMTM